MKNETTPTAPLGKEEVETIILKVEEAISFNSSLHSIGTVRISVSDQSAADLIKYIRSLEVEIEANKIREELAEANKQWLERLQLQLLPALLEVSELEFNSAKELAMTKSAVLTEYFRAMKALSPLPSR